VVISLRRIIPRDMYIFDLVVTMSVDHDIVMTRREIYM